MEKIKNKKSERILKRKLPRRGNDRFALRLFWKQRKQNVINFNSTGDLRITVPQNVSNLAGAGRMID